MDGDSNLRQNDPYRGMRSAEDDTRPDFLKNPKGVASGEKGSNGFEESAEESSGNRDDSHSRNARATDDLNEIENGATANRHTDSANNLNEVRKNEEEAGGLYSGKGKDDEQSSKGKISKGFLKKRAPILAIFLTIFGAGGMMFGMQSLLPFAIEELLIEKFNSIGVSSSLVSDEMLDLQLNQGIREGAPDRSNMDTFFGLSDYQVQQFRINGIDSYNIKAGGKSGAVMLYKKHNGEIIVPVVGSTIKNGADEKSVQDAVKNASGVDESKLISPVGVSDALDDKDFYVPYMSASKVWRNGTSSWFDKIMKNVTEVKLGVTRTRWAHFIARSISNAGEDAKKQFNDVASGKKAVDDKGVDVKAEQKSDSNDDSEAIDTTKDGNSEKSLGDESEAMMSKATNANKIRDVLNSKAVRAAQVASSVICGAANAGIAIYSTVQAYQALQFLNLVSGFLEAVDRVKAGDGDTSPMMEYASNLTEVGNTYNGEGEPVKKNKTAVASAGMAWLFGKSKIDNNDQSVQNVNFETVMNKLTGEFGTATTLTAALEKCGYARIASGVIDVASDAILLVTSAGIGNVIKFFVKKIATTAMVAVVGALIGAIAGTALRQIAKLIIKNAATEWFGEDLGNALISGASRYLGGNGTSGGQGPGTKTAVMAYQVAQQEVIAREAEYQRATKNPFDTSSKYTFLGSLAYSILPLAYSGGSLMSVLTNVANTTSNVITAMLPTADAIDVDSTQASAGSCQLLEAAGIQGDAFCNPYIITDTNTTKVLATTVYDKVMYGVDSEMANVGHSKVSSGNFEENGEIKKDSDLAKYITYCGQRTSQYSIYDASIASRITESGKVDKIMGYVPVLNDIASIMKGVKETKNRDWINGKECVVGGQHWADNKYYQRYAETERLIEGMNPDYTSSVTAYLTDYYEENPLDTSFEGTLARFSGQTKEDVVLALDLMDYYNYLDNYDPMERYAFVERPEEDNAVLFEGGDEFRDYYSVVAVDGLKVVYDDLRWKYYTNVV